LRLANVTVPALDEPNAKAACILYGQRGTHDLIDVRVVLNARRGDQTVITSDPADLRHLDAHVRLIEIQHRAGELGIAPLEYGGARQGCFVEVSGGPELSRLRAYHAREL